MYAKWKSASNKVDFWARRLAENYAECCLSVMDDMRRQTDNDFTFYFVTVVTYDLEARFVQISFSQSYNISKEAAAQRM